MEYVWLDVGRVYVLCLNYFLICSKMLNLCAAYAVGLIITFLVLVSTASAQPALIYLVPCVLIPVYILALCRHELGRLWSGKLVGSSTLLSIQLQLLCLLEIFEKLQKAATDSPAVAV